MLLTGNEDLRVQKTIEAISKAFDEMILEMDYSQITVTELARRARINKKTFYHYYTCIDDLLDEKQQSILEECLQILFSYKIPEDLEQMLRDQFYFYDTQGGLYERIICCKDIDPVLDFNSLCAATKQQYWDAVFASTNCSPQLGEMVLKFIHSSMLALYKDWVRSGKVMPFDEMVDIAVHLVCRGANGIIATGSI